jgi:predicted  nucleic acid-binding Zn-ribbon protein
MMMMMMPLSKYNKIYIYYMDKEKLEISENLQLLRNIQSSMKQLQQDIFIINNELKCIKSQINDINKNNNLTKSENISKGWTIW